jgi:hypothetical protein
MTDAASHVSTLATRRPGSQDGAGRTTRSAFETRGLDVGGDDAQRFAGHPELDAAAQLPVLKGLGRNLGWPQDDLGGAHRSRSAPGFAMPGARQRQARAVRANVTKPRRKRPLRTCRAAPPRCARPY